MNNKIGGVFITFKYRYRKQIIIGAVISVILIILIIIIINIVKETSKKEEPIIIKEKNINKNKKEKKEEKYKVDIKGEILSPGIYSLNSESRIIDVIELAGGLTENADTSVINLSKKIIDEMVIIIYSKEEVINFKHTKEVEEQVQNKCNQPDDESIKNDACINRDTESKVNGKISINTGTLEELMTLTGIGEAKAKDIIAYREKNGSFTTIEDLKKVPGIGESTFAQIKEDITL